MIYCLVGLFSVVALGAENCNELLEVTYVELEESILANQARLLRGEITEEQYERVLAELKRKESELKKLLPNAQLPTRPKKKSAKPRAKEKKEDLSTVDNIVLESAYRIDKLPHPLMDMDFDAATETSLLRLNVGGSIMKIDSNTFELNGGTPKIFLAKKDKLQKKPIGIELPEGYEGSIIGAHFWPGAEADALLLTYDTVHFLDAATGILMPTPYEGTGSRLSTSPKGTWLYSEYDYKYEEELALYPLSKNAIEERVGIKIEQSKGLIGKVRLSPDEEFAIAVSDYGIYFYNVKSKKLEFAVGRRTEDVLFKAVAMDESSKFVNIFTESGEIKVYNADVLRNNYKGDNHPSVPGEKQVVSKEKITPKFSSKVAEFSPSGRFLVVNYNVDNENRLVVWDVLFNSEVYRGPGLESPDGFGAVKINFSSDSRYFYIYNSQNVEIFKLKSKEGAIE